MKDSLFDLLLNFFEKSLNQITDKKSWDIASEVAEASVPSNEPMLLRRAHEQSIRVFTPDEQRKLTKASYQFLMRLMRWDIISKDTLEIILHQLFFSESPYVTLSETKWTIRNILAEHLSAAQLVFLDLVLYRNEDALTAH